MANPFDEVEDTPQDKPKIHIQSSDQVSISFNKRTLERAAYIVIILVLGVMVFFNPLSEGASDSGPTLTGNVVLESEEPTLEVGQAEEEKEPEETTQEAKEEKQEEPEEEEKEESSGDVSFAGNFELDIVQVETEKDEDGNPKKMVSIDVQMKNEWRDLTPKLEVFWYDEDTGLHDKVRGSSVLATVHEGKTQRVTLKTFDSYFLTPLDDDEQLEVKMYDAKTGEHLATTDYVIT